LPHHRNELYEEMWNKWDEMRATVTVSKVKSMTMISVLYTAQFKTYESISRNIY